MITAATQPADSADVTAVETAGRCPLLLLLASAAAWLVVSGILGLLASLQLHAPSFLAGCSFFTFGHMQAMAETAFTYGWIGNAAFAVVLWMLGRLSGEPLRAPNWVIAGTSFWNLGTFFALIGIGIGGGTAVPGLQIPGALQPIMLAAYAAIAVSGVLAWSGRRRDRMFAAQYYAVAALFLFPWLFSAAQVALIWSPVRGVAQAITAGWYAQCLWSLWIAPVILAAAYYVVPRVTGKVLPAYDNALLGFWLLVFIGGFTGGRHLVGGPVPAWVSSLAIVSAFLLLVHYFIIFLNLRPAWGGGGVALRFIGVGLLAYLLTGLVDAVTSVRGVAVATEWTLLDAAQAQLAVYGAATFILLGAIYFAVPRILGRAWASSGCVTGHWVLSLVGLLISVVALAGGGWTQSKELADAHVAFADITAHLSPWLLVAAAGQAVLLLGNLLFALNLVKTAVPVLSENATAFIRAQQEVVS